jgi:hypothetical protein
MVVGVECSQVVSALTSPERLTMATIKRGENGVPYEAKLTVSAEMAGSAQGLRYPATPAGPVEIETEVAHGEKLLITLSDNEALDLISDLALALGIRLHKPE